VPWLLTLDASRTLAATLASAWAMAVAFTAAVFAWLGVAVGDYTQTGAAAGVATLLLAAPLFQPQFLAFALARGLARRSGGRAFAAIVAAAAWAATEALVPRLLDDTLGHGLHPSRLVRQAADLGGATGLTVLLLLANEGIAAAIARRAQGVRAMATPLALAALVPLLLAGYGVVALSAPPAPAGKPLRMALVQSNIVDYERLRREKGAGAVVREVLDTHEAMSRDAVDRHRADAVLWSETVYPTTFGHPKSEAGAELDREILALVDAAGVPFVFGTYDRDDSGEYNAAAFVAPRAGLVGFYRKTRLFPLTEHVPAGLDGPTLRRWLPWAGSWRPGSGARVFPLRLADGREIPVLPLICLDDVDAGLAIDGARLGAQAILTMSNDSWFTDVAQGAELHHAVAAFRSIETRLPQFRVTSNGLSAVIDATGSVIAAAPMGERALLIGDVSVREPPRTLMVVWGDWVGRAAAAFLVVLAAAAAWRRWRTRRMRGEATASLAAPGLPADVAVLPFPARVGAAALRAFARASLLWMAAAIAIGDRVLQASTLDQLRTFATFFLAPEAAAGCLLLAFAARATIENGALALTRGKRRLELTLADIGAVEPWRVPLPSAGLSLQLASGERWHHGLAHPDPAAFSQALTAAGAVLARGSTAPAPASRGTAPARVSVYSQSLRALPRGRLDHPLAKFVVFPLALAIPAFRLHQHIAYGGTFGEYYTFGLAAYLRTFALWWAAWAIGVVLCAAALRATIEAGTLVAALARPDRTIDVRRSLERLALLALYLGVPAWLLLRIFAG